MAVAYRQMPWPVTVATARLTLRPVAPGDRPVMAEIWTSQQVREYLGGPVPPGELAARLKACAGAPGLFAVARTADGAVSWAIVSVRAMHNSGHCPNRFPPRLAMMFYRRDRAQVRRDD